MFGQNNQRTGRRINSGFRLITGKDDDDNALFQIMDNELQLVKPLDYETKEEYTIRVKGTDPGGLSIEKVFTINVDGCERGTDFDHAGQ